MTRFIVKLKNSAAYNDLKSHIEKRGGKLKAGPPHDENNNPMIQYYCCKECTLYDDLQNHKDVERITAYEDMDDLVN